MFFCSTKMNQKLIGPGLRKKQSFEHQLFFFWGGDYQGWNFSSGTRKSKCFFVRTSALVFVCWWWNSSHWAVLFWVSQAKNEGSQVIHAGFPVICRKICSIGGCIWEGAFFFFSWWHFFSQPTPRTLFSQIATGSGASWSMTIQLGRVEI